MSHIITVSFEIEFEGSNFHFKDMDHQIEGVRSYKGEKTEVKESHLVKCFKRVPFFLAIKNFRL